MSPYFSPKNATTSSGFSENGTSYDSNYRLREAYDWLWLLFQIVARPSMLQNVKSQSVGDFVQQANLLV